MFALHESGDISDTVHFPKLSQVREPDINLSRNTCKLYKIFFASLSRGIQDVETFCTAFHLFANAFSVDFKYFPSRYQLDVLNLQNEDLFRYKYKNKSGLVDF